MRKQSTTLLLILGLCTSSLIAADVTGDRCNVGNNHLLSRNYAVGIGPPMVD